MEVLLCDAAVFNVKNAFERLHIEEVHFLQVLQQQGDAAQLFPHQRRQVQVQGLLGADGHAHQDAQELELKHVLVQARRRVEEEPGRIKGDRNIVSICFLMMSVRRQLGERETSPVTELEGGVRRRQG